MTPKINAAERAGRAAKTAMHRRRKRQKMMGTAAAALVGVPLLFAAVWLRVELSARLEKRDDLRAEHKRLERSLVDLASQKAGLTTWEAVAPRAQRLGLRAPTAPEVVWVAVPEREGRTG